MTVAAIVQCTPADLVNSRDPDDYVIGKCLEAGFIDEVVLACPDGADAVSLEQAAETWGVQIYKGSDMNVAARLLGAAQSVNATIIVRVLLRQFYLDVEQLDRMVTLLKTNRADYIDLPPDYNYALAADVATVQALSKAVVQIENIKDDRERSSMQFSPWVYMEEHPHLFNLQSIDGGPDYELARVEGIRSKYARLIGENQTHFKWNYPASSYGFMGKYLAETDTVLDIACGKGQGVRRLKEYCATAVGVDLTPDHIDIANRENGHIEGIEYREGDAETYVRPDHFDAIISLHTLEHLPNPDAFFECSLTNLKPNGKLLLEVPLLLQHPLNMPLMPWHHKEYAFQELVDAVVKHGFHIDEVWAKKRHAFVPIEYEGGRVTSSHGRLTAGIVIAHRPAREGGA